MKKYWLTIIPIVLTAVLVFILFVPIFLDPNFQHGERVTVCNGTSCGTFVQYDSLSYEYAGWGAYVHSTNGYANYYTVQGWICFCGLNPNGCCVPPYGWLIWPIVELLFAADMASIVVVVAIFRQNVNG